MKEVYFDNQSNTRLDERVLEEMLPYLKDSYGNPQSMYSLGAVSKDAVDAARRAAAKLINAQEEEVYFTSCGSESNNLAIKGVAAANSQKGKHIIVSSIEHFSVLNSAKRLSQEGYEVTHIPVDNHGTVSVEELNKAIRKDTVIVSVQHANTEIGTVQPVEEISKIAHSKGALFHTDAVCTAGTIPVDTSKIGADLLSFSGSQFYGPKGAAALYIKKGVRVIPQIDGGIQENGRRAGTENVPAIAGFGKACEIAAAEIGKNAVGTTRLRDRIIKELPGKVKYLYLNGHPQNRLPGNVNFSVEFVEGEGMFLHLDAKGILVSSGSACASKALKMSHVLSSIGVDAAVGQGSILMSLSKYSTDEEVDYLLENFPQVVEKLRSMSPLFAYFEKTGQRKPAGPGTDFEH